MVSFCLDVFRSHRGLLASVWSMVTILTAASFLLALIFTWSGSEADPYADDDHEEDREEFATELVVSSRAMAFCALCVLVLACLVNVFGTVILGWQSPLTGTYYACCSPAVHKTTPAALGSFIGSCIMFANITLTCCVLFGEFEILDYREAEQGADNKEMDSPAGRSSTAFSILCLFLTLLYGSFCALSVYFSTAVLEEWRVDFQQQEVAMSTRSSLSKNHFVGAYEGGRYITGESFRPGFVPAQAPEGTLA